MRKKNRTENEVSRRPLLKKERWDDAQENWRNWNSCFYLISYYWSHCRLSLAKIMTVKPTDGDDNVNYLLFPGQT